MKARITYHDHGTVKVVEGAFPLITFINPMGALYIQPVMGDAVLAIKIIKIEPV